jgi:hypothetical protein
MRWESSANDLTLSLSKGEERNTSSRASVADEAASLGGSESNRWPIG